MPSLRPSEDMLTLCQSCYSNSSKLMASQSMQKLSPMHGRQTGRNLLHEPSLSESYTIALPVLDLLLIHLYRRFVKIRSEARKAIGGDAIPAMNIIGHRPGNAVAPTKRISRTPQKPRAPRINTGSNSKTKAKGNQLPTPISQGSSSGGAGSDADDEHADLGDHPYIKQEDGTPRNHDSKSNGAVSSTILDPLLIRSLPLLPNADTVNLQAYDSFTTGFEDSPLKYNGPSTTNNSLSNRSSSSLKRTAEEADADADADDAFPNISPGKKAGAHYAPNNGSPSKLARLDRSSLRRSASAGVAYAVAQAQALESTSSGTGTETGTEGEEGEDGGGEASGSGGVGLGIGMGMGMGMGLGGGADEGKEKFFDAKGGFGGDGVKGEELEGGDEDGDDATEDEYQPRWGGDEAGDSEITD